MEVSRLTKAIRDIFHDLVQSLKVKENTKIAKLDKVNSVSSV